MSKNQIIISTAVFLTILAIVVFVAEAIQNLNRAFEDRVKAFEAKVPNTVLIQSAWEGGWSDDFQINDENVFLFTMKIYNVTELWKTQYAGSGYVKYSFVFWGIVYFYRIQA